MPSSDLETGESIEARVATRRRLVAIAGGLLLPAAWLLRRLAFGAPVLVETYYSRTLFPWVAGLLGGLNGWLPWSLAESVVALTVGVAIWRLSRRFRSEGWPRLPRGAALAAAARRHALRVWIAAGVVTVLFLVSWGLHYARPPLQARMALDTRAIAADEVLALARELVARANAAHALAGAQAGAASILPLDLDDLDRSIDRALRALELPGDRLGRTARAKPMASSRLLSYLGISGIYIPFTGEPSFNRLVPDASLPVTVAHEKAHQRGITDEGEANMVAVLACASADEPYLRYAAYLYAASTLVGAAGRYAPERARATWGELDAGPRADVAAIAAFWDRHRGPARRVATRVNDAYLKSNRVPGGVESYGRVVRLLVGAHRKGRFLTAS